MVQLPSPFLAMRSVVGRSALMVLPIFGAACATHVRVTVAESPAGSTAMLMLRGSTACDFRRPNAAVRWLRLSLGNTRTTAFASSSDYARA